MSRPKIACPDCGRVVLPGATHGADLCALKQNSFDAEQAFWDACVAAMIGNAKFTAYHITAAHCEEFADAANRLVAELRFRTAAHAKGG